MLGILRDRWKFITVGILAAVFGVLWMGFQVSGVAADDPHAIYRLAIQQMVVDAAQSVVIVVAVFLLIARAAKVHVPLGITRIFIALFKSGFMFFFGFTLMSLLILLAISALGVGEDLLNPQKLSQASRSASDFGQDYFGALTVAVGVFWGGMMAWACTSAAWVIVRTQVAIAQKMAKGRVFTKPRFISTFFSTGSPFSWGASRSAWLLVAAATTVKMVSIYMVQYDGIALVFAYHLLKILSPMLIVLALEQFFISLSDRHFCLRAEDESSLSVA